MPSDAWHDLSDPGNHQAAEAAGLVSYEEIAKHATGDDCWIVVNGRIYDVTNFLEDHPGGKAVIEQVAGKDGTDAFLEAHPEDIITMTLGPTGKAESFRGLADASTMPTKIAKESKSAHKKDDDGSTRHFRPSQYEMSCGLVLLTYRVLFCPPLTLQPALV